MGSTVDEVDRWVRKCAYDVGFTKSNTFIGQTNFIQNFVRSFSAMVSVMVEQGLITDMIQECSRRRVNKEEGGKAEGNQRVTLVPKSVPKPKDEDTGRNVLDTSQIGNSIMAQHFNFSKITIKTPIIEIEAPKHTFKFQHQLLTAAQSALEIICYNFSKKHYPSILARNRWTHPEAGELTTWIKELIQVFEFNPLPVVLSINDATFPQKLRDLGELRHTAVHRIQVSGGKLWDLLDRAFTAANMFGDREGINTISMLFHGQSDCLALAEEVEVEKTHLRLCVGRHREYLEEYLRDLEKNTNEAWESTLFELDRISYQQRMIDAAYENILESQLVSISRRSRKDYTLISSEFHDQLPEKPKLPKTRVITRATIDR